MTPPAQDMAPLGPGMCNPGPARMASGGPQSTSRSSSISHQPPLVGQQPGSSSMNPNAPNFPGPGMGGKFSSGSSGSSGNMSGNPASTTSSVPASSNTPAFSSAQPPAPAASTQANQVTGEIILSTSYQQHSLWKYQIVLLKV